MSMHWEWSSKTCAGRGGLEVLLVNDGMRNKGVIGLRVRKGFITRLNHERGYLNQRCEGVANSIAVLVVL